MKLIEIFTDGACSQNGTWEGGWGFYIKTDAIGVMGYELKTTNNRMELTAVIRGLRTAIFNQKANLEIEEAIEPFLEKPLALLRIIIYTDSSYVANAYNKKWIVNWKRNGWKNSKKETVKNKDLWEELDEIVSKKDARYTIEFVKVKGHSGVEGNEIADTLATTAIKKKLVEPMLIFIEPK